MLHEKGYEKEKSARSPVCAVHGCNAHAGSAAGKADTMDKKSDSAAKTGDAAEPMLYAVVMLLAAAVAGTAVLYRRKAKN